MENISVDLRAYARVILFQFGISIPFAIQTFSRLLFAFCNFKYILNYLRRKLTKYISP